MQRRKFAAKLIYLISSLIFVIINGLIAAFFGLLGYNKTDPETTLYLYAIVFGGFGGYLSISININKLELETEGNNVLHIVTSISRVFIAMISSLVVLVMIKSNIFLGLLNESNENFEFVIYSFCVLAGFSESFIPNILKNSEKNNLKANEEK